MISTLAHISTKLATLMLRACGCSIIYSGRYIIYHERSFCVVDACSGIRSLVALTITALAYALLQRLPPLRSTLLLLCAALLAILGNSLRIALTVLYPAYHTALGYIIYIVILLIMLHTGNVLSQRRQP